MNKHIVAGMLALAALGPVGCATYPPAPPPQYARSRPVTLAEIKELVKAGVADEVVISQIRNCRVEYHLTTAEILDLKNAGVSQRVIDFMINTPGLYRR